MNDAPTFLLTYHFSTDPNPLQVSTAQTPATGRVNTGVFNENKQDVSVYCSHIVLAVPVGLDAPSLFAPTPSGAINTNKWTVISMELKTAVELEIQNSQTYATFGYKCVSPTDYLINYNLVFGLSGQINQSAGPVTIYIWETSGTSSDPKTFTRKKGAFTLSKALPKFYLQNFVARASDAATVPATDFKSGDQIFFSWESNGTDYQLFMKNQPAPVYHGSQKFFLLTAGVSRETTFILQASVTGDPSQDTPGGGYEPIYLYDSLTITVSNPAGLHIGSGESTITNDRVSVVIATKGTDTGIAIAQEGGSLGSVNLLLQASGAGAYIGTTSNHSLVLRTGDADRVSVDKDGTFTANSAHIAGPLSVAGPVSMFGKYQPMAFNKFYTAATDGIVYATTFLVGGHDSSAKPWQGFTHVELEGVLEGSVIARAVGCTTGAFKDYAGYWPSSLTFPVPKGAEWMVQRVDDPNNQTTPAVAVWWIPLGTTQTSEDAKQ
jgi:hypothetical protein